MKNRITFLLLFLFTFYGGFSQQEIKKRFSELVKDKQTYSEIISVYQGFIDTIPESEQKFKFEKHFARWAFYQSYHLGSNGEFVNISKRTLEAVANKLPEHKQRTSNGNWTFAGPTDTENDNDYALYNGIGRVDRIAFHPTNPNIIYIGTPAGGLWKTTNGGSTWTSLSSYIPSLGVSGIVIDHSNTNRIYVLTGDGDSSEEGLVTEAGYVRKSIGVMVSNNGGQDWELTGELSANDYAGLRLVQSPVNANLLLAATTDGLYKTVNGGDTWTLVHAGLHYDIEFQPNFPNKVYTTKPGLFYYSNDTANTWHIVSNFDFDLCAGGRVEIGVTPDNNSKVYLFAGPRINADHFCGFFESNDSGNSFTRILNTPNMMGGESYDTDQSDYDLGIAVSPTDEDLVFVAGLIIWKTEDGGQTPFANSTTMAEDGGDWYVHCDIHDVAINPLNGYVYAASDGGFYVSTDNGASWDDLKEGVCVTQSYHMDDYNSNANAVIIGSQDNGIKYKTNNSTYLSNIGQGDGYDVVINYSDQSKGYAVINDKVKMYTDFFNEIPENVSTMAWFPQIEMHSSDTSILYMGYSNIFKSVSGNMPQNAGLVSGYWALKTCPSNSTKVYCAGSLNNHPYFAEGGRMSRGDGTINSFETISDNPGFPEDFPRISDIGVKPTNSNNVYASFTGYTDSVKVLYSTNSGDTWTNVTYDLPNVPVWSIEVDASNNVYIGTDIGVYYKSANATSWEPFYNNLPNVPISDLSINEVSNQLLASTFGRGIWKSELHTTCPVNITINENVSGTYFQSASNSVSMSGTVTGGVGTNAILRSENYVDLDPGFRIESETGNKFLAYVGDCEEGLPPEYGLGPPVSPSALSEYNILLTRQKGTLEVVMDAGKPTVKVRQFKEGTVKVLLLDNYGNFITEVANYRNTDGVYDFNLPTKGLIKGLYFIYLIVDGEVTHLQELEIQEGVKS